MQGKAQMVERGADRARAQRQALEADGIEREPQAVGQGQAGRHGGRRTRGRQRDDVERGGAYLADGDGPPQQRQRVPVEVDIGGLDLALGRAVAQAVDMYRAV
jgi:translation elongation factor EF-Tu-like GTPase